MEDKTVRVIWPTTREDGTPLPLGRISHADVAFAVRNEPDWFGTPRRVEPVPGEPHTDFIQQALDPGKYYFRARCFDDQGREGEETVVEYVVGGEADSPPGPIVLEISPA